MSYSDWEPVIGLEVHAQMKTETKIFSSDPTSFGNGDNENTSVVSFGLPGALPTLNKKVVETSVRTGLALSCKIRNRSVFSRKNYFYPDLPKGYQISQYDKPLCEHGELEFDFEDKTYKVRIERAHMEEDAGKSTHQGDYSLVNLNRAGIPLLEIVSGPDMHSPAVAAEYARKIRQILRYIGTCDGNLEEGSLRCDCNVSIRKKGTDKLGTKVEIKNINSFRFIEKALDYEIERQINCQESGEPIFQETRLYDPVKNKTVSMRKKEEAHDYRYFPDPDLLPCVVEEEWIEEIRESLPELPEVKRKRFIETYNLPDYDAQILTQEKETAEFFERVVQACKNPKAASNWIMTELLRELNEAKVSIQESPISAAHLGELIQCVEGKVISGKMAKVVFTEMWKTGKPPKILVEEKGLKQITDSSEIDKIIDKIFQDHPDQVEQYRAGKQKLFGFFVGQIMKVSRGQANPETVNQRLKEKLSL